MADESKIPKGRVRRSAKLGSIVGVQGARYAGTKAANVARSEEGGRERLEQRHLETAMKMVGALGQMKGAAMKLGQFASFIDTEFLPEEYREIYQEQLAKLRTDAPPMPWEKVEKVLQEEYDGEPVSELFAEFEPEAFAAASIGQVHRAELLDGRQVAVKIQYPGIAEALDADLRNAGTLVRLARALAPGLDAKAIAHELRERVMEELDYEYEAQNQRTFSRAYRDHPFIYVPDVVTRLSRRRVLVTELVEGMGFEEIKQLPHEERSRFGEIVFRGSFGSIYHLQHFNADPHPGNYILMDDGRVAFLDFGMTKKLDREQIVLEQNAVDAASRNDPEAFRAALHDLGFVKNPSKLDAERLMEHVRAVGGWYVEDREIEITPRRVMKIIESTNDPRSEYYDLMRRESIPADELMGRRMEIGVVAVLGQLRAKRNWHRIARGQERDPRPAGAGAPLGQQAAELLLRLAQLPAPRQLGPDLEADVVARPLVLAPRVAEADDQNAAIVPADGPIPSAIWTLSARRRAVAAVAAGPAAEQGQRLLPFGVAGVAGVAALALFGGCGLALGRFALFADQLRLFLDDGLGLLLDARRREGGNGDLLGIVGDELDAVRDAHRGKLKRVVDLHRGDVDDDPVGDLGRQRLDGDLAGYVLQDAALFDAGRALGALQLDRDLGLDRLSEVHLLQVDVLEVAAHRVQLLLLDDDRNRSRSLDLEVEERVAVGEDRLHVARRDLEGARFGAAGVDDAGNQPPAPQAAGGARAELRAGSGLQSFACGGHRTGEDRETARNGTCANLRPWPTTRRSPRDGSAARPSWARSSACRAPATPAPRRPTSPAPRRAAESGWSSATWRRR